MLVQNINMALRRSKKKEPSKEEFQLKERLKVEEGVFDLPTLRRLAKLFSAGIISRLYFKLATGKEADIFLAEPGDKVKAELVVLKIFRIQTTKFRNRLDYVLGDPRFGSVKQDMFSIVATWCKKEFGNLEVAEEAKVNAPRPYDFVGNILAMQFIGKDGMPAPILKDVKLEKPDVFLDKILEQVKKLYKHGLVHADLSEYNILVMDNEPYLIDFGQAVVVEHPSASEFLKRDLSNIISYFSEKYGINKNVEEAYAYVKDG